MRAEVLYDIPLADAESLEKAVEIAQRVGKVQLRVVLESEDNGAQAILALGVMASELQANLESEAGLAMNMSLRALGKGDA
jgi:hypothetical protein